MDKRAQAIEDLLAAGWSIPDLMALFRISRATAYRRLKAVRGRFRALEADRMEAVRTIREFDRDLDRHLEMECP